MTELPVLATFFTSKEIRQRWRDGPLAYSWSTAYPDIFDDDDWRIVRNVTEPIYHYYHEWLAAILLYHTQGLLSLVEKYTVRSHKRKINIVERLCDAASVEFLLQRRKEAKMQYPDLIVYRPDLSDWFFCEVRWPRDRLRPEQLVFINQLEKVTGKKIYMVELLEAKPSR